MYFRIQGYIIHPFVSALQPIPIRYQLLLANIQILQKARHFNKNVVVALFSLVQAWFHFFFSLRLAALCRNLKLSGNLPPCCSLSVLPWSYFSETEQRAHSGTAFLICSHCSALPFKNSLTITIQHFPVRNLLLCWKIN